MQTKKYIRLLAHPDISPSNSFDFVLKLINWIQFIAAFLWLQYSKSNKFKSYVDQQCCCSVRNVFFVRLWTHPDISPPPPPPPFISPPKTPYALV